MYPDQLSRYRCSANKRVYTKTIYTLAIYANTKYEVCSTNNCAVCCTYVLWYNIFINWYQGGVSPQSSVLLLAITVSIKSKVKKQKSSKSKVKHDF